MSIVSAGSAFTTPRSAGLALVGAAVAMRLIELAVARRNDAWLLARGGVEHGRRHYPFMVALHVGLLLGCVVEPIAAGRDLAGTRFAVGVAMVAAAQVLRWWTIATLGRRWSTRVIVVPGLPLVSGGPFRFLRHPNYLAVALEVAALPWSVGAFITAAIGTALNGVLLLAVRIPCEERALGLRAGAGPRDGAA